MSRCSLPIAALGLLAFPLLVGCVGEETDAQAAFPQNVGSDDMQQASQGGIPEIPGHESAMGDMADEAMPGYADDAEVPEDGYADDDPSALADFRGPLDPHGQWLEDPEYGTMWQPAAAEVGTDFAPYMTGGHWGYDDSNYVWVSDYSWGWAPYHYGRWAYGSYGWGWIPGRAYAPAWVTWRTGAAGYGYVGWAPLPPTWAWGPGGVALGLRGVPTAPYAFCSTRDLFAPNGLASRVVTAPGAVQAIAAQTHPYAPAVNGAAGARVATGAAAIAGPSPRSLNIPQNLVNHVAPTNPQLARAQQFSHSASAMALGAHGPAVNGHLGAPSPMAMTRGGLPGGAVAGHALIAPRSTMPSYGGSSHSYYDNRSSTQLGSSYGHGGSMRSYASPSPTHLSSSGGGTTGVHPTYQPYQGAPPAAASTSSSSAHFGGHYGSSAGHASGGHR